MGYTVCQCKANSFYLSLISAGLNTRFSFNENKLVFGKQGLKCIYQGTIKKYSLKQLKISFFQLFHRMISSPGS
jgi:hypothetical protein